MNNLNNFSNISPTCQRSWPKQSGIRIGALNVCSLPNKLTDIATVLDNQGTPLHILGISESRCTSIIPDNQININNYKVIRSDVPMLSGSNKVGVAVYIHDEVKFHRRLDLECLDVECIWIQVRIFNKLIILGHLYRHPDSSCSWFDSFSDMLDGVFLENKPIFLLGDFNIDLLVNQRRWENIFNSYFLNQLITLPTRVTQYSSTLIDHIYTNDEHCVKEICVPISGISDHYPVLCTINFDLKKNTKKDNHKYIYYRSFKNFNADDFLFDVANAPFHNVYQSHDTDSALDLWIKIFIDLIDKHAPLIPKRVKYQIKPPWLTNDILMEMRIRDELKSNTDQTEYKKTKK